VREPLPDDQARVKMRAALVEWQREWDALPWHAKLRRRFESWRKELFWKPPAYDDETLARSPALAEMQRKWDALPRREKWLQRLEPPILWLGNAWLWVGSVVFFVGGLFIKFVVPGGSAWLHVHTGTFFLICLAPLVLMFLSPLLGWVALPFILAVALWRRVRR
jgi:hypothetical protein